MSGDFTYFRKYIILRNDYKNIDNIEPRGHGKIEIKGNKGTIKFNLENCEVDEQYRIYLLKEQNGIIDELDLGRILTDERGKGRKIINIKPKELELKGFSMDKLAAIVIRRDGNILLSGYIEKPNGVIDRYVKSILAKYKEEDKEESIEMAMQSKEETKHIKEPEDYNEKDYHMEELVDKTENRKFQDEIEEKTKEIEIKEVAKEIKGKLKDKEVEENIKDEKEIKKARDYIEEVEKKINEEIEDKEVEEKVDNVEDIEKEKDIKEEIIEERELEREINNENYIIRSEPYQNYKSLEYMRNLNNKNQMTNYILSVLKFFPQVQPFKVYLHGYTWWRIDDDGSNFYRGFLPYYNYLLSANYKYPFIHNVTTCINQIIKYGHYLFGLYKEGNDVKYYVYGVPGRFAIREHPFKGITGFNTWYESIDNIGYWILYIDPMNGKVIYPINPMVPTK